MKFNTVHTFLFIMLVVAMFGFEAAFAQIELGGKSMMKELPFIADMASTAQDILFLSSKVIGAGLAFVGVKNAGQRNWDNAIPAFVGGSGLFFLPQIVSALAKIGG
jgi:hypothetical protein